MVVNNLIEVRFSLRYPTSVLINRRKCLRSSTYPGTMVVCRHEIFDATFDASCRPLSPFSISNGDILDG